MGTLRFVPFLLGLGLASGCAETSDPTPPPLELLFVVNAAEGSLTTIELPQATLRGRLPLQVPTTELAAVVGSQFATVVATGGPDLVVIQPQPLQIARVLAFPPEAVLVDAAVLNDSIAFVADMGRGLVVRVNMRSGDTLSLPLAGHPNGVALQRGRLFVLSGNLVACLPAGALCSEGASWVNVVDLATFSLNAGTDSIALLDEGHARYLRASEDGFLYAVSEGDDQGNEGRLSIIDPIRLAEIGNFGGFGVAPGRLASDRGERLLLSSTADGLMVFDTRRRSVTRGAGNAIRIEGNAGVAVDSRGSVYAVERGGCDGSKPGRLRFLRPDLTDFRLPLTLGDCAGSASIAFVPIDPDPSPTP